MSGPEQVDAGRVEDREMPDEPERDLAAWRRWRDDQALVAPTDVAGVKGRFAAVLRRVLNPLVKRLWKRQIGFNLSVIDHLEAAERARFDLLRDLREIRHDLLRDVQNNHRRIAHLEAFKREGYADVMRHSDALYAMVDQKLDRYRRQSQSLWSDLGALLTQVDRADPAQSEVGSVAEKWEGAAQRRLQESLAGADAVVRQRLEQLMTFLPSGGQILEVGCGSGDALALLSEAGFSAQGIEADASLVESCKQRGLSVSHAALLDGLASTDPVSQSVVLSRQVVEQLDGARIDRLVRLAWRALEPGGTLILESANPLSLTVAARNFWRDPEPRRPVHPETLVLMLEERGFETVECVDLSPFAREERLSEFSLDEVPTEQRQLAERLQKLRDELDDLLFGHQAYAVVGRKPG